jgi:hypothetical protein
MKHVAPPAVTANCIRMLHESAPALVDDARDASVARCPLSAAPTALGAILVTLVADHPGGSQDIERENQSR